MSVEILVLYHSMGGATASLAEEIATGVEQIPGATARVRCVPGISSKTEATESDIPAAGPPYACPDDLRECDGLAVGSPTRFGNMSAEMKYFWDTNADAWQSGWLVGKPACCFTATATLHGGQEATLLSMMIPLFHHGMILLGCPYNEPALTTTRGGGTPYGPSHYSGERSNGAVSEDEKAIARTVGKRLAETALKLKG